MMTIFVIIAFLCIPLAFIAGGFIAFKGVHLGLRWQIQTAKQEIPTMEIKNPITPIIEAKQEREQNSILHEYLNGVDE